VRPALRLSARSRDCVVTKHVKHATECIGCGCLSLERCKLSNPEDRAARLGPGPRYWVGDRPTKVEPAKRSRA
jgi:hypothetical protein